jgi:hypothetical protein
MRGCSKKSEEKELSRNLGICGKVIAKFIQKVGSWYILDPTVQNRDEFWAVVRTEMDI